MTSGDAHDSQRLEIATLRAENDRLIALLESHGIEWRTPQSAVVVARELEPSKLSTAEKVALFRQQKDFQLQHGFLDRDVDIDAWIDRRPLEEAQRRLDALLRQAA